MHERMYSGLKPGSKITMKPIASFLWSVFLGVLLFTPVSHAQFTNKSSVLDGSGTTSSGGSFTNISAAGQPGGIAVSSSGGIVNQAGFLNTFSIKPGLDTDGDGIVDELDQDNDNDGLADINEINGVGFNPSTATLVNVADTDGDGVPDGWEAVAGTDPTDINALLELIAVSNTISGQGVAWLARGNNQKTYVVRARESLLSGANTVIFSNVVAGGIGPWFAVTNTLVDVSTTNVEFYAVEVLP